MVKASCHRRACNCLSPDSAPYLFTAVRATRFSSPLSLLRHDRIASHGFTSGFQPFWPGRQLFYISSSWPRSTYYSGTSDPMAFIDYLHRHFISQGSYTWWKRKLVGGHLSPVQGVDPLVAYISPTHPQSWCHSVPGASVSTLHQLFKNKQ